MHRALRVLDTGACLLAALLVMGYYLAIPGGPAHRSRFQASRNGAEAVESRRFTISSTRALHKHSFFFKNCANEAKCHEQWNR